MLRALLSRLTGGSGEADAEGEESGFLPSRLDASVLSGHGMGTAEAECELEEIEAKSEILEEAHTEVEDVGRHRE